MNPKILIILAALALCHVANGDAISCFYINNPGTTLAQCQTLCAATPHGLPATPLNSHENDMCKAALSTVNVYEGLLGAQPSPGNSGFQWAVGPAQGTQFYNGFIYTSGSCNSGQYCNFCGEDQNCGWSEPNGGNANPVDIAMFGTAAWNPNDVGAWNDVGDGAGEISGCLCQTRCTTYNAFQDTQTPAFGQGDPVMSATQMDGNLQSTVTVSLFNAPGGSIPVRFLVFPPASQLTPVQPLGVGALSDLLGNVDPNAFWLGSDFTGCTATKNVTISPTSCPSTNDGTKVTFTCTVYAMLLRPNPLDNTQYMATTTLLTIPYTFEETVSSSSVAVEGVYCGVSITTMTCVSTRADVVSLGTIITPSWVSNCQLLAPSQNANFRFSCTILPPQYPMPQSTPFEIQAYRNGVVAPILVGQDVTVPAPRSISIDDSGVTIGAVPAVIGNQQSLSFTVTSKVGGTLNIVGLQLTRSVGGSPYNVPASEMTVTRISNTQETVTWLLSLSVLTDPTLYVGSLTINVITRITISSPSARANLPLEDTYRVESVIVGTTTLTHTSSLPSSDNHAAADAASFPIGAIIGIAVGTACLAALAGAAFLRASRRSARQSSNSNEDGMHAESDVSAKVSNPLSKADPTEEQVTHPVMGAVVEVIMASDEPLRTIGLDD